MRSVQIGGEIRRTWSVCDDCLAELRGVSWVTVEEDGNEITLRVTSADLLDGIGGNGDGLEG